MMSLGDYEWLVFYVLSYNQIKPLRTEHNQITFLRVIP